MPYRVIQWATGNVGRAAVEGILAHPELELVGTWVHGEAKDGRDVGELCGLGPVGVKATRDVGALEALDADCVLYSPIIGQAHEVLRLLRSGKNVVTPLDWFFPGKGASVDELHAACTDHGVTLHGTGIHPGGITERFPLMLSALSRNIRHVRAEEFSDIRNYDAPDVVREIMLFGKTPEEVEKSAMPEMMGKGFLQSVDMIAHELGFDLDPGRRTHHEYAVAREDIDSPAGIIAKGTVAAQRFTWEGLVHGEPVITARTNWFMGDSGFDPDWTLGEERFEVEITGEPPVAVTFHGLHPPEVGKDLDRNPGIIGTAMHCVNAIPYVCAAEPGIQTYLDLPLVAGRAAADLGRKPGT